MMINFNIDLSLIVAFLVLNLVLGLWCSKGVKSIRDFALGGRYFSTMTLAATLISTWIGGSAFNIILSETYTVGILALNNIGQIFNLLFITHVLIPRMQYFLGKLSIAEVMDEVYGRTIRIITAVCSIIKSITMIAIQVKVFSTIFNHFFGVNGNIATIISSFIVIIYSTFGGIRAVILTDVFQFFGVNGNIATIISSFIVIIYSTFGGIRAVILTDVFQFLTFGAFIPTFGLLIWMLLGSWSGLVHTITTNPIFDPKMLADFSDPKVLKYYGVFFYCAFPCLNPAMLHMLLIAHSTSQAAKAFKFATGVCLFFISIVLFTGVVLRSSNIEIEHSNMLPYLIDSYTYPGFKAMIVIGVIALVMSTADSYINSSAVMIVHDLCRPLGLIKNNEYVELMAVRVFSVVIGIVGLCISLLHTSLLDILLYGSSFYTAIVGVPLLLTMFGFRTTKQIIILGMAAGAITLEIWRQFFNATFPIGDILPATCANFIVTIVAHWILKASQIYETSIMQKKSKFSCYRVNFWQSMYQKFMRAGILVYYSYDIYRCKHHYMHYTMFTVLSLFVILFASNGIYTEQQYGQAASISTILSSLAVTIALLCTKTTLEQLKNKYIGFLWHIIILFTLVFSNVILALAR